jgi:hypothetical protein
VRLSTLKGSFAMTMREAQIGLYREVVDRGWYARPPRARNGRTRAIGLLVLVPLTVVAPVVVVARVVAGLAWYDFGGSGSDGVEGFADATDSLFSFEGLPGCGTGFDGCDGCDLPGCDF